MSRKRNEYLEVSDDEDDGRGDSESEIEDSRFYRVGRGSAKRRKIDNDEDSEASVEPEKPLQAEIATLESTAQKTAEENGSQTPEPPTAPSKSSSIPTASSAHPASSKPKIKPLTPRQLAASQAKARKTGVIYLSRIPPFMKPSTLRRLLSPYGELLRIFLTPEPTPAYTKRVRSGGNKKRSFVDGWVEFASKRRAKIAAETLNGQILGGKKGGWYHDDLWNIKYLKGFKWDNLMEQVQSEAREREGRLRAEIQQEARERRAFLENVESAKVERGREAKKRAKRKAGGTERDKGYEMLSGKLEDKERTFRQNKVKERDKDAAQSQTDEVKRVLSKIF